RPDILEAVAHAALVICALEDEARSDPRVLLHCERHLLELLPGLGSIGEAALLEEGLAVVEQPGVRIPWHAPDLAVVGVCLHRSRQESISVGETVGEVEDPAVGSELRRPDHVAAYD